MKAFAVSQEGVSQKHATVHLLNRWCAVRKKKIDCKVDLNVFGLVDHHQNLKNIQMQFRCAVSLKNPGCSRFIDPA